MRDLPWHMSGLLIKERYEISQMRLALTGGRKRAGKKNHWKALSSSW